MVKGSRFVRGALVLMGLLTVFVVVAALPAGAAVRVGARLDRPVARIGEQLVLTFTVGGELERVEEPKLPSLDAFDVYGGGSTQSLQITNGKVNSQRTFTWYLRPKVVGKFEIPSLSIRVNGAEFRSPPLDVEIRLVGEGLPAGEGAEDQRAGDEDLFITLTTDKDSVVVGEPVLLRFAFHRRAGSNLFESPQYSPPSTEGFWREELPPERRSTRVVDGRRYSVTEVHSMLFPARAGSLIIGEATVRIPPDLFRSFMRRKRRPPGDLVLSTKPLLIRVYPLPAGSPEGFQGTVGEDLRLEARVSDRQLRSGDAVTLQMRLSGSGNVAGAADPQLDPLPGVQVHDAGRRTGSQPLEDRIEGWLEVDKLLVPESPGELRLPLIRYPYYDTARGEYVMLEVRLPALQVEAGPTQLVARSTDPEEPQDIRHLLPLPSSLPVTEGMPWSWIVLGSGPVLWLASLLLLAGRRLKVRPATVDPIAEARRVLQRGNLEEEQILHTMRWALGVDGEVGRGLSLADLARRKSLPEDLAEELHRLELDCAAARYASASMDSAGSAARALRCIERIREAS